MGMFLFGISFNPYTLIFLVMDFHSYLNLISLNGLWTETFVSQANCFRFDYAFITMNNSDLSI